MSLAAYPARTQRFSNTGLTDSSFSIFSAHASANTKSTWQELEASLPFDVGGLLISIRKATGSTYDTLIDLGIGAAAAEQVLVANIFESQHAGAFTQCLVYVPVFIPAGTRLSTRIQATVGGITLHVGCTLISAAQTPGYERSETWGANTTDSGGTQVDPGASANTKGAWSEVVAASGFAVKWINFCIGNQENATETTAAYLFDIGVGPALSEQVIVPNLTVICNSTDDQMHPPMVAFPVNIPAGSRVAVRAQSSTNDATDRLKDVVIQAFG